MSIWPKSSTVKRPAFAKLRTHCASMKKRVFVTVKMQPMQTLMSLVFSNKATCQCWSREDQGRVHVHNDNEDKFIKRNKTRKGNFVNWAARPKNKRFVGPLSSETCWMLVIRDNLSSTGDNSGKETKELHTHVSFPYNVKRRFAALHSWTLPPWTTETEVWREKKLKEGNYNTIFTKMLLHFHSPSFFWRQNIRVKREQRMIPFVPFLHLKTENEGWKEKWTILSLWFGSQICCMRH